LSYAPSRPTWLTNRFTSFRRYSARSVSELSVNDEERRTNAAPAATIEGTAIT